MYKKFFKKFYEKDAYLRNRTIEEYRKDTNQDINEYDLAGIGIVTDDQIVFERTQNDGRGHHLAAFANLSNKIYDFNYDLSKTSGMIKAQSEFVKKNIIEIRMVNEANNIGFYIIPSKKISQKQYELFEKFTEKYSETFKEICSDLEENIIFAKSFDDEILTNDLTKILPYLESIIDYTMSDNIQEKIIGEEYESLMKSKVI